MVKKINSLFVILVLFAVFLFAGCSTEVGNQMPTTTDNTAQDTTGNTAQEQPQDVLDETLNNELVTTTTEEVEIGSLI